MWIHSERLRVTGAYLDAAVRYAGPDAVLSGAAASRVHGLKPATDDGTVFLLMPHGTRRASVDHVVIERTRRLPTPVERSGIPIAPIDRSVIDAARNLNKLDDVRALLAEAVQRRFTTPDRLRAELAWEINSVEYHSSPVDQERTERRVALMRRHHIELVEHRPRELRLEPARVKEDLRSAYERAVRRPRPPITMRGS